MAWRGVAWRGGGEVRAGLFLYPMSKQVHKGVRGAAGRRRGRGKD